MSGLATALIGVFNEAHWMPPKALSSNRSPLSGNGVSVYVSPNTPPRTRSAANTLVKALGKVPIVATAPTGGGLSGDVIVVVVAEKVQPVTPP
jgi:hypothetical protein